MCWTVSKPCSFLVLLALLCRFEATLPFLSTRTHPARTLLTWAFSLSNYSQDSLAVKHRLPNAILRGSVTLAPPCTC